MSNKTSRMLIGKYVSENIKTGARTARACNIARWFILNFPKLEGTYVPYSMIRKGIPNSVKNMNLNAIGDKKAHGDAVNHLGLSNVKIGGERHIDMSLINLKRCTSFCLGSRNAGAIYIKAPQETLKEDLELLDELDQVCGKTTVVFKQLNKNAKRFVANLTSNYPSRVKAGKPLTDKQRAWALDLITNN